MKQKPLILVPAEGTEAWKRLLAKPELHWKVGYSAHSIAHSWQAAGDFHICIKKLFETAAEFKDISALLILPEHRVPLPGGNGASQCDVWVLASCGQDLVSIAVEGKMRETFGPLLSEWRTNASPGKQKRLEYLQKTLELESIVPDEIRYQLLHRTASAIKEAKKFQAKVAVMIIQSFSKGDEGVDDFLRFTKLLVNEKIGTEFNKIIYAGLRSEVQLYLAWVQDHN